MMLPVIRIYVVNMLFDISSLITVVHHHHHQLSDKIFRELMPDPVEEVHVVLIHHDHWTLLKAMYVPFLLNNSLVLPVYSMIKSIT